jgi:hypothetical protein
LGLQRTTSILGMKCQEVKCRLGTVTDRFGLGRLQY